MSDSEKTETVVTNHGDMSTIDKVLFVSTMIALAGILVSMLSCGGAV